MYKDTLFWGIAGVITITLFILISGILTYETFRYPDYVTAATTSAVSVTAGVAASISCSTNTGSTDFGTWTDTSIKTSTPNASTTMSCANVAGGCTLYVKDNGGGGNPGLWNSSASSLIESPNAAYNATDTLATGVEGYGIQAATTTAGSGATLGIVARYLQTGNTVGGLLTSNTTVASSTATTSAREIVTTHKAAVASATPSGSYADTITYECTAN